jgi:hypothetical protein
MGPDDETDLVASSGAQDPATRQGGANHSPAGSVEPIPAYRSDADQAGRHAIGDGQDGQATETVGSYHHGTPLRIFGQADVG